MYTVDKSVPPMTGLLCSVTGPSKGPQGERKETREQRTYRPNKAPVGPCMASEEVRAA